jgi:hypothetical protein
VRREAEPPTRTNEPLRRVVLVPLDRVPVVHRELVVEVVIALAQRDERRDEMVARGLLVVERGLTQDVRDGVNAERTLCALAQHHTHVNRVGLT